MQRTGRSFGALIALLTITTGVGIATSGGVASAAPPTSCPQYEQALRDHAPPGGWDVAQMSAIMARESACKPAARSARDTGLLQINDINLAYLSAVLGTPVTQATLSDPVQNVRAGAALCTYWVGRGETCTFPWKLDLYRPPGTPATTVSAAPAVTAPVAVAPAPAAATTTIAGRCTQYEPVLQANAPKAGWDVTRMSKLMWAVSRCNPSKRWPTGTGLLRISDSNQKWLGTQLGQRVDRAALTDATVNVRAAAALCQASVARKRSCYQPWGG